MYIESVEIKNIWAIDSLKMRFEKPAGWHVIIGDNGVGKSSVIQSIALALIGEAEANALRQDFSRWLRQDEKTGKISLSVWSTMRQARLAKLAEIQPSQLSILFKRKKHGARFSTVDISEADGSAKREGFSAGFGSFRRLGGAPTLTPQPQPSASRAAAHFSLFNEDTALSEALVWLKEVDYQWLKLNDEGLVDNPGDSDVLTKLKAFVNAEGLLPNGTQFVRMGLDGPVFNDASGAQVSVGQLSDGSRSVLGIVFQLIWMLVQKHGFEKVFAHFSKANPQINLPGIVLIDEIDAHLHPSWQTRIGQWFLKHFPNIQFIVTTHSPLICRAANNGSIYRLAVPGSDEKSVEITGLERDRLIYGNILDAYATDAFGEEVTDSSPEARARLDRLIHLNQLYAYGKLPKEQEAEMHYLRKLFATDDTFVF